MKPGAFCNPVANAVSVASVSLYSAAASADEHRASATRSADSNDPSSETRDENESLSSQDSRDDSERLPSVARSAKLTRLLVRLAEFGEGVLSADLSADSGVLRGVPLHA